MSILPEAEVLYDRRPFVNWVVLVLIVGVFVVQYAVDRNVEGVQAREAVWRPFVLSRFGVTQLTGYMWLQRNILYVVVNVIFLRLFGSPVCGKVGNLFYLPLYVGFGVVAGIVHLLADGSAMVGAGGAICGIVGMYLVFYPVNSVSFEYYGRGVSGTVTVPGWVFVILWLGIDAGGVVATGAHWSAVAGHVAGFVAGVAAGLALVAGRVVRIDPDEDECILQVLGLWKERSGGVDG